jgi:hypothetical protein
VKSVGLRKTSIMRDSTKADVGEVESRMMVWRRGWDS